MIVFVLEFENQRIEFPTIELANQYKIDNDIDAIPFEFEKVVEEIIIDNSDILAIEIKYPELLGMNYKLLSLDNLEGIKRDSTLADKGLKGEKKYRKDGVLIWSSEKKYWFQEGGYVGGFRRLTKLFNMDESVAMEWENFYDLSPDDKKLFEKQQREFIFEYFKSQQPELFNFLYTFFSKEINDYIMADGDNLKNTLINMAENHPYQDENGVYIVRATLNQVIPTLTPGVTTTVLQGIIDELV
ncbi:hypothetical protein [Flavobacterium sp.]|uniref:hypothetical protein n=1 Tax=Flavobacterium sp. TaxID=239 RepID=UPI00262DA69D|nr:hypothetical protein [Flavobacterium sp.]